MNHVRIPTLIHPLELETVPVYHGRRVAHGHAPTSPVAACRARQPLAGFARVAGSTDAASRASIALAHVGALG